MITPSFGLTATERVLPRLALDWTTGLAQPGVDVARTGGATFIGSNGLVQYASEDTQRIDYSAGVASFLVEESRTNLVQYSEDFSQSYWVKAGNTSVASTTESAPDGTNTASRITGATSIAITVGSNHFYLPSTSCPGNAIFSVWLKRNNPNASTLQFRLRSMSDGNDTFITVTLTDEWQRFFVFRSNVVASCRVYIGQNSDFLIWGAQLENASFFTSYIPTSGSTVTRNADVATMTGTNFSDWFNDNAGTFFIETNARNGDDLLTAGSYVLAADTTALKKYATTYGTDPSATQLVFGNGNIRKVMYYPQELIAAELAALTT
jgi:hypothetical protein